MQRSRMPLVQNECMIFGNLGYDDFFFFLTNDDDDFKIIITIIIMSHGLGKEIT